MTRSAALLRTTWPWRPDRRRYSLIVIPGGPYPTFITHRFTKHYRNKATRRLIYEIGRQRSYPHYFFKAPTKDLFRHRCQIQQEPGVVKYKECVHYLKRPKNSTSLGEATLNKVIFQNDLHLRTVFQKWYYFKVPFNILHAFYRWKGP